MEDRPTVIDDDGFEVLIKNNPVHMTKNITELLYILYECCKAFENI